jgi:hypothetical protein
LPEFFIAESIKSVNWRQWDNAWVLLSISMKDLTLNESSY